MAAGRVGEISLVSGRDKRTKRRTSPSAKKRKGKAEQAPNFSLEIELKLAGTPGVLKDLWSNNLTEEEPAAVQHLVSTYFDTADLRLRRRGCSLRVRQKGGAFTQTIKEEGVANQNVTARGEWSVPLEGPEPDVTKFEDPTLRDKVGLILADDLRPIFATHITRHVKKIKVHVQGVGEALVEAAWDQGEVVAGDLRAEISELELEVIDGMPGVLRHEASRLHTISPLEYQPLSKAARGFELALEERPRSVKMALPILTSDQKLDDAMEAIFSACARSWLSNHAAAKDGTDIEGVHQVRVGLRRLHSAGTLFKSRLPKADRKWLLRTSKAILSQFGAARDWDVFLDETLPPLLTARPVDGNLLILKERAETLRSRAYEDVRQALGEPAYLEFILKLGSWIEERGWRHGDDKAGKHRVIGKSGLAPFAGKVLARHHAHVIKKGENFDMLPDEALHRLRIAVKKLRYATEFFASLYPVDKTKPYIKALRQLQDDLGHLNDVAVAESSLIKLSACEGSAQRAELQAGLGTLIGWYSHSLSLVRPRIGKDWAVFASTQPFWE
ncbi:MAG: CHAD domain-containing protein [Pseudomonadota bacterium]